MQGLLLALAAYTIWGCFPLFFNLLSHVSSVEVLANRIIWSMLVTMLVILVLGKRDSFVRLLKDPVLMRWLALTSLLISANWLIFIWAVAQHRVMEASLGYYMTPLISLLLARVLLKEALHPLQAIAGGLAAVAVGWELFSLGSFPWVSLSLALSFGFYGLVRKRYPVDGLNGLTVETMLIFPLALGWLAWQFISPAYQLDFGGDLTTTLLLVASGVMTAIPLLLFAAAAKRLDLSVVGFIMYINPTMQFLIAVLIFKEDFPPQRLVTFLFIWTALVLFMWGMWMANKKSSTNDKLKIATQSLSKE
ncbi:EamA family transporter RarD [Nitrincola sp.]|uniref:EamA family transporter RarD n=1 Tax=Nitrincola sp. TaxID=1926584 RepID=UPI003A90B6EB